MTKRFDIELDRIRQVLDYNPESGVFTWKTHMSSKARKGSIAGTVTKNGYRVLTVDGYYIQAPRLAWFYMTGSWPSHIIRFMDGDKSNCSINNLRDTVDVTSGISHTKDKIDAVSQKGLRQEYSKHFTLKKTFGIGLPEYQQMFVEQGGVCAICARPESGMHKGKQKWLAVDHCHATGKIRGLLCEFCNKALGMFQDHIERLDSAIKYLERHKRIVHIDDNRVVNLHPRYSDKQEFSTK